MKNGKWNYLITAIGLLLLGTGLILLRTLPDPQGFLLTFPYICIGIGCGVFGHGLGNIISQRTLKNHPDVQKQLQIDRNDERNITLASRAKAKAFDAMTFMLGALMISFALMGVELTATLLLVFVYLLIEGYAIYTHCKLEKEM